MLSCYRRKVSDMNITTNQVQNILKIYGQQTKTNKVQPKNEVPSPFKADQVTISADSRVKQKAVAAAKVAPEVRQEKVDELRQAIAAGTYTVSNDEVAEKMIYRSLVDKLV